MSLYASPSKLDECQHKHKRLVMLRADIHQLQLRQHRGAVLTHGHLRKERESLGKKNTVCEKDGLRCTHARTRISDGASVFPSAPEVNLHVSLQQLLPLIGVFTSALPSSSAVAVPLPCAAISVMHAHIPTHARTSACTQIQAKLGSITPCFPAAAAAADRVSSLPCIRLACRSLTQAHINARLSART